MAERFEQDEVDAVVAENKHLQGLSKADQRREVEQERQKQEKKLGKRGRNG